MRVYKNEPLIKRRAKLGQYVSWGGLAILALGMLLSFRGDPGNLRIAGNTEGLVRGIARDRGAIGYWDYAGFQEVADQLKVVPIDGVSPTDQTIGDGTYPLATTLTPLVVVVSPINNTVPEAGLTTAQLAQVFSNQQYRWSGVDPAWPNTPIKRFSPDTGTDAYVTFVETVMNPVFGDPEGELALIGASNPNYRWMIMGSFACLILGFIAANVGGYNTRRFGRSPRPDERLAAELKGFDDRYMLFAWMTPAPYVLAGPSGVYTFALREQAGQATNIGNKWKQPFSISRVFLAFSNEGIGNPTLDAQQDAHKLQQYLARHGVDEGIEVQPIILFTNPKAQLDLKNPEVPVLSPQGLKALFRQRKRDARLTTQRLDELGELFQTTPK